MVLTLKELPGWVEGSRGTNWCQPPPVSLGLLLQSQLAPSLMGSPGGQQVRGGNVYTP